MSKSKLLLVIFLIVVAIISFYLNSNTTNMLTYTNENFTINYPISWESKIQRNSILFYPETENDESISNYFVISSTPLSEFRFNISSFDELMAQTLRELRFTQQNFEVIESNEMKISGYRAQRIVFVGRDNILDVPQTPLRKSMYILILNDDVVYTLGTSMPPDLFDDNLDLYDDMVDSFEFV